MVILRGPAALLVFVLIACGIWWSFDYQHDRLRERHAVTTNWLAIETPGLATQLAIQQQRLQAGAGRYETAAGPLVNAWAAQLGGASAEAIRDLAARHPIAIEAGWDWHEVTVHVRRADGPFYRVRVSAVDGVTRTCDDAAHDECRGGTWTSLVPDEQLLPST
jgi:hypothetical protein